MNQAKPSKSERKREQLARQELGERLIGLDAEELRALPIDARLRDAITDAATMRARGALRRQKQLIGRLMRDADADAIQLALDKNSVADRISRRVFADAEAWRDRVIAEGAPAVEELSARVPDIDETLDGLVSELRSVRNERPAKHLRRQIFRAIHSALLARAQNDRIPR